MIEHAGEIINLLLWALGVFMAALVALGGVIVKIGKWIAKLLAEKLAGIETAIKDANAKLELAIKETNATLGQSTGALREDLMKLERRHEDRIVEVERRVSDIATRCHIYHEYDKD